MLLMGSKSCTCRDSPRHDNTLLINLQQDTHDGVQTEFSTIAEEAMDTCTTIEVSNSPSPCMNYAARITLSKATSSLSRARRQLLEHNCGVNVRRIAAARLTPDSPSPKLAAVRLWR